jgi:hypothetical protein
VNTVVRLLPSSSVAIQALLILAVLMLPPHANIDTNNRVAARRIPACFDLI